MPGLRRYAAAVLAAILAVAFVVTVAVRRPAGDGDTPGKSVAVIPHTHASDLAKAAEESPALVQAPSLGSPPSPPGEGPRQEPDLSALPSDLAAIADEDARVHTRLVAVRRAGAGPETVSALFDILDHSKLNETVRNEICNALGRARDRDVVGKLVAHLDKMVRDKGHSPLWRDYCTQHLQVSYVRHGVTEALGSLRWAASEAEEPKVRSAGLYSLGLLAREMKWLGEESDNDLAARAPDAPDVLKQIETQLHVAFAPEQHVDVRTNAVRAAFVADRRNFIPAIRKLLADDKQPLQLRNACASVLGQFRDPGSVPALEAAAKSGPKRLTKTAERSLKKISEQPHVAGPDAGVEEAPTTVKPQDAGEPPPF